MKVIYVKIDGITCDHCRNKITNALKKINHIKNITFDGNIAKIEYEKVINKNKIIDCINLLDYSTNLKLISEKKNELKRNISFKELMIITTVLVIISIIINKIFGFNIFNIIPTINSKMSYAMLLGVGILTSIHCISMCGAINLVASSSNTKNFKKPLLYNLGRLISYTLVGGIVGLIGSVFTLNSNLQGIIIILAATLMFALGLNMMGIISFRFPRFKIYNKNNSSFIIGIFNGLMPCGPLQAMQIYALATGSFLYGALSMFLFCLGTIPLMLFVGMLSNFLNGKKRIFLMKVSTVLILILSLVMFNRGLLNIGIDISRVFAPNYDNYIKSEIKENYQVIEFDLSYSGYRDIIVKKGIPVKMIIDTANGSLTGCNNSIIIKAFNIKQDLKLGENIIEFTPNKTGKFTYTCWMGMIKNNIVVVEDY